MSENTIIIVENHSSGLSQNYSLSSYQQMLIKMLGIEKTKKVLLEASIYKKRTFECPITGVIYTLSFLG